MNRVAWCGLVFAPALVACRSPTQISVSVDTNVACPAVRGTSFTSGELGAIESVPATTETTACNGAHLGSIVLVPSGEDDALVGFKVVTALDDKDLDYCASDAGATDKSCIVSRRALRYLPHTALSVKVTMDSRCEGVACDPRSTCVRGGCVAATIPDPSQCAGNGCDESVLGPVDAGVDATLGDGAPPGDGAAGDATIEEASTSDAPNDTGIVVPPPDGGYLPPADCDLGGTQPGAAWPQAGFCPTHRNRSPYVATTSTGVSLHSSPVDGTPGTAPAVAADGTLFVATQSQTIEAFNPDGSLKWRYTDPQSDVTFYAMPLIAHDGTVHAYSGSPSTPPYVVLSPSDGGVVSRITGAPSVTDGVARISGGIDYVLNDNSGALESWVNGGSAWSGPSSDSHVVPTVAQSHTIFLTLDGQLTAVEPDGSSPWGVTIGVSGDSLAGLAIGRGDDSVRGFTVNTNVVFSYSQSTHAAIWSVTFDAGIEEINGISIGDDGTVYVGTQSSGLVAVDTSGHRGARFGSRCNPPVIDPAGTVIAWCDEHIVALPSNLGTPYWSVALPNGGGVYPIVNDTPVIGPNGLVYFTMELGGSLPDGGPTYGLYRIGP